MAAKINWAEAIKPLLKKYQRKEHPLEYRNLYQLMVMVVLSAQTTDNQVNLIGPKFFDAYPDMNALSRAAPDALFPFIHTVRNFGNKAKWLVAISQIIKEDENIPLTMEKLTSLPGIGRKSANVIMSETGKKAEGVVVDLHVVRVAPRLGIATGVDPKKIEKQLMDVIPQKDWGKIGMAISFLGRETCRPKNPGCTSCLMNGVCKYYGKQKK